MTAVGNYARLHVSDSEELLSLTAGGLVQLPDPSLIDDALFAVANGTITRAPPPLLHSSFAVSYIHAQPQYWTGEISRGKFLSNTRQRLKNALIAEKAPGLWLDQALAQRRRSDSAGWAVVGLLPYATFRVLVIANFATIPNILSDYIALERLPDNIIETASHPYFVQRICDAWNKEWKRDGCYDSPNEQSETEQAINFVELCRFWPMMERAVALRTRGLLYEQATYAGLRAWIAALRAIRVMLTDDIEDEIDTGKPAVRMRLLVDDMSDLVYYSLQGDNGNDRADGFSNEPFSALASVTSWLGSGALMGAPLFDEADRNALLMAGACFSLLAHFSEHGQVPAAAVAAVLRNPRKAFHRLAQTTPATYTVISDMHAGANALYNRPTLDEFLIPHASVTDELTIFDKRSARKPINRRWMGQWELIPHLSLCFADDIIDIGERAVNAESNWISANPSSDISGKPVAHLLASGALSNDGPQRAIFAISSFSTGWSIRQSELETFGKLGGWNSTCAFLGICIPQQRRFVIHATLLVHFADSELKEMANGELSPGEVGLNFVNNILRRSTYPLQKAIWLRKWMETNFNKHEEIWYKTMSFPLHDMKWEKWWPSARSTCHQPKLAISTSIFVKYTRVGGVHLATPSTRPQLALEDAIEIAKQSLVYAQRIMNTDTNNLTPSSGQISGTSSSELILHSMFQYWLGAVNTRFDTYDRQNQAGSSITEHEIRVFIPACSLLDNRIHLISDDIFRAQSAFMQGMAFGGHAFSMVRNKKDGSFLNWNLETVYSFYSTGRKILSSLHCEALYLYVLLACIISLSDVVSPIKEKGTAKENNELALQSELLTLDGDRFLTQYKSAITALVVKLVQPHIRRRALMNILEKAISNSREDASLRTFTVNAERIQGAIGSVDEATGALRDLIQSVCSRLESLESSSKHVLDSRLEHERGETKAEACLHSFSQMLDVSQIDVENEMSEGIDMAVDDNTPKVDQIKEQSKYISEGPPRNIANDGIPRILVISIDPIDRQ